MKEIRRSTGIYINPDTAKLLKIYAAVEGKSISEVASLAIANYLLGQVEQRGTIEEVNRLVAQTLGKINQRTRTLD